MSGSLTLLQTVNASNDATVSLGASEWQTDFNVYKVVYDTVKPSSDGAFLNVRFLNSGSADTTSNYDRAFLKMRTDTSFSDIFATNEDKLRIAGSGTGTGTSEVSNGVIYLFNFNVADEFSFMSGEETMVSNTGGLRGNMGGGMLTVNAVNNGIQFLFSTGNIASGRFSLYAIRK